MIEEARERARILRDVEIDECIDFPYAVHTMLQTDALLIESLSAQLELVTSERDAVVKDLKLIISGDLSCAICGHYAYDEDDESRICADCDVETYSNWQWRGVEVRR